MTKASPLKAQEQQIVHCLRQHDVEGALQLIVAHFHEPLYWAIRKWVLVHEDADDVLQLSYVRIYKGLSKFAFKSAEVMIKASMSPFPRISSIPLCCRYSRMNLSFSSV